MSKAGQRLLDSANAQNPAALLHHLQRMPMTEWVWNDAEMIFATLSALSHLTGVEVAAKRVLNDIDDCRSANRSIAELREVLNGEGALA